ncbi:MAG: peptide deformylase [Desulfobacterales bacterium]
MKASLLSIILQHEIDHLKGILFIDWISVKTTGCTKRNG